MLLLGAPKLRSNKVGLGAVQRGPECPRCLGRSSGKSWPGQYSPSEAFLALPRSITWCPGTWRGAGAGCRLPPRRGAGEEMLQPLFGFAPASQPCRSPGKLLLIAVSLLLLPRQRGERWAVGGMLEAPPSESRPRQAERVLQLAGVGSCRKCSLWY